MGIRDTLKKREEQRDAAANGGNSEFPEGVTRYARMGKFGEVNADGRTFVILADPDKWYFYFVHEHSEFNGKTTHFFRKHTCTHSPRSQDADIIDFFKPGKQECVSCKAGAKRKMYAMIPVYDLEYKTYRVIDTKEFHVNNLISDYDKFEKTMRKVTKDAEYSIVGEAVLIKQVDKSFSLESGDATDEEIEAAKAFIGIDYGYEELANFREESDIVTLLQDALPEANIDKSVLPAAGAPADVEAENDPTEAF